MKTVLLLIVSAFIFINGNAQWQSAIMNSKVKNPSKPQKAIYDIIKEIYPLAELNYPVIECNRNIDIAILEYKIAIEYDGFYWHKNKKEDDTKRQIDLECLGWKFIRYAGGEKKDIVPSVETIINDIKSLIGRL